MTDTVGFETFKTEYPVLNRSSRVYGTPVVATPPAISAITLVGVDNLLWITPFIPAPYITVGS